MASFMPAVYSAGLPPCSSQERAVDLLNMDTTVLNGLNTVSDLEEFLHRHFWIGIGLGLGKFHQ